MSPPPAGDLPTEPPACYEIRIAGLLAKIRDLNLPLIWVRRL
jgi:hypothetical protein